MSSFRPRHLAAALCFGFALATTASANAETAVPPAPSSTSAQTLYRDAYAAIDKKEWLKARDLLLELWGRARTHDVAISLGMVEHQLGRMSQSARYVAFAVANVPPAENDETIASYRAALAEAKKYVATLWVTVTPAEVELFVEGEPAELSTGEQRLGVREVYVDPGQHTLEARAASGAAASELLLLSAGEEYKVELKVTAPAVPGGKSTSSTQPVEDGAAGVTPSERSWLPAYVLGGVTVASFATSMVFRKMASDDADDAETLRSQAPTGGCSGSSSGECTALRDAHEQQDRNGQVANVTLAIAGVGAAATVGYVVYTLLQPTSEAPVRATVALDGSGGGLLVSGWF